jgi:transposase-like protein
MGAVTTTEIVDVGGKRTQRGHCVLPVAERLRLIAAYHASGMTMAAFARRESIKYATFAGWVSKAARRTVGSSRIEFARVQVPEAAARGGASTDTLEVRLPDGTMLRGGGVADLAALIRALRS